MTVVDSSVLIAAAVDSGADGRWAEAIVAGSALAAPALALAEATNILRRLELAGRLGRLQATAAQQDLLRLEIDILPFAPLATRIWELRANLTSYDAWYVAAAERLEAPLATLDRRLARAGAGVCRFLLPA